MRGGSTIRHGEGMPYSLNGVPLWTLSAAQPGSTPSRHTASGPIQRHVLGVRPHTWCRFLQPGSGGPGGRGLVHNLQLGDALAELARSCAFCRWAPLQVQSTRRRACSCVIAAMTQERVGAELLHLDLLQGAACVCSLGRSSSGARVHCDLGACAAPAGGKGEPREPGSGAGGGGWRQG